MKTTDLTFRHLAGALIIGILIGIAGTLLTRARTPGTSERIIKLEKDSADFVSYKASMSLKYHLVDSAYRADSILLSSTLEELFDARAHRPASHIHDNDSLQRAIETELGIVQQ